jgi:hypothetical protein
LDAGESGAQPQPRKSRRCMSNGASSTDGNSVVHRTRGRVRVSESDITGFQNQVSSLNRRTFCAPWRKRALHFTVAVQRYHLWVWEILRQRRVLERKIASLHIVSRMESPISKYILEVWIKVQTRRTLSQSWMPRVCIMSIGKLCPGPWWRR